MKTLAGWQFPIRLVLGLGVACGLRALWPAHHYGWIVLTVALLTQRQVEHLPVKTIQRTLGVLLGVALTWLIVTRVTGPAGLGLLICVLAPAAALARARSYLAYSALSTPVILLVIDFGRPVQTALLADRIIATLAGAAIVVALNLAFDRLTPATWPSGSPAPRASRPPSGSSSGSP
jgi:Fusaric acid resistance protein-like